MDKLTSMRVFTKVAKTGSFAAAAKELGISRAMATKHIMHLENTLGVRLLNRTTRRINLTEAGTAYLDRCLQTLDDIEETELAITQLHSEPRGTLKISTPPFFGTFHLAPAIAAYLKRYPDVTIEVTVQGGIVDLIEEGLDMAIRLGQLVDSSLIARKLASSRLVVCGSPDYLKEHGAPETPHDLKKHNCLVNWSQQPQDKWRFTGPDGKEISVKVSGLMQANTADPLRLAAVNGLGLVLMPTYMVGQDLHKGRLQALLPAYEPPSLDIHAVYPHRKHLSAKVRTFVDLLYDRLQPTPYWDNWMNPRSA